MRTIKFRAWDSNYKIMHSWDDIDKFDESGYMHTHDLLNHNIDGVIPMQFTGLHDKNGKEIYEGDIITWNKGNEVVYWNDKECAFYSKSLDKNDKFESWLDTTSTVVGNIYENPKLLSNEQ
jgi:uncharacterized phage protein (TIGR01671 family)